MKDFNKLFNKQIELQVRLGNYPFKDQNDKQQFINIMSIAAIDEIMEAIRETQWKPWKQNQTFNEDNFKAELIDLWHFVINLSIAAGMTADDVYDFFCDKNKINHERQDQNY